MSECDAETIASVIAELAYSAVKAGVAILDIPKYVEAAIQEDARFSDPEMRNFLKIILSNSSIKTTSLM